MANGLLIVTACRGPSEPDRSFSPTGDPIEKDPAGTTTISGQFSHSRKLSFGLSAHSSAADSGAARRDGSDPVAGSPPHVPNAGVANSAGRPGGTRAHVSASPAIAMNR
jgi:hypothetical protein